ncbi:MAG: chromate efflux transporter [Curvibacter sp.]|nr:chromate efflux transporter [Curvibacter sp.]
MTHPATPLHDRSSLLEVFGIFLRLGCTSFGGPVAHLGYFRQEFVQRRRWLDDAAYADLVAMCQFLPGPASSQVGIGLGLLRRGLPGALLAWLGFTLPSVLALVLFAQFLAGLSPAAQPAWLHGLKVCAVAVVAQALWGMGRTLCPDRPRATLAALAAAAALLVPGPAGQLAVLGLAGLAGCLFLAPPAGAAEVVAPERPLGARGALVALLVFAALLLLLPLWARQSSGLGVQMFDVFYRSGALVFGGGHVVLPVLQAEVVPRGWVDRNLFLAGYGAAQAVPGPLFTFAAFLGAAAVPGLQGWLMAGLAVLAIFLPGFLLVLGVLPLWARVRHLAVLQRALQGVNTAVVGLLLAAFYQPVWTGGIQAAPDFVMALLAFVAAVFWRVPPWALVVACALVAGRF